MKGSFREGGTYFVRFNMMLKSFFRASGQHGVLATSCLGASIPLFAFLMEAQAKGLETAAHLMVTDPFHIASLGIPLLATIYMHRLAESRRQLAELVCEREVHQHRLMQDAFFDALTGLPNRRRLEVDLHDLAVRNEAGVMLAIDIDKFKFVNDTMGHDAGDAMLQVVANRVRMAVARAGRLYRLGGDEFVVLATGTRDEASIIDICRSIEISVGEPLNLPQGRVVAGVSIGVTFIAASEYDFATIFKRADLALYRAKEISGPSHAFFDPALAAEALDRIAIERDLLRGLADQEFFIEYQPILDIHSHRVMSLEALLRWNHPVRGMMAPDAFIPLAERTGLILPIGRWVLREACRAAASWPGEAGVAVNVSGDQFKDSGFVPFVRDVLAEAGLEARRLTIEVTESVFTVDVSVIQKSLSDLRAIGVKIALDDFGTGFSSINNLKRFPLDHLKIDKCFTDAMLKGGSDGELVSLMSRLGDAFQLSTTIEGIETHMQLEFARLMGIQNVQGFLISRPIPADQVAELLTSGFEVSPVAMSA